MPNWCLVLSLLLPAVLVAAQTLAQSGPPQPVQTPIANSKIGLLLPIAQGARGLAVDRLGNIYIADTMNNRVVKVPQSDLACSKPGSCTLVGCCWTGSTITPMSVAVGNNLDVYIGYTVGAPTVISGGILKVPYTDPTCSKGTCFSFATDIKSPVGVAIDSLDNIYIADENNGQFVFLESPHALSKCQLPVVNGYCEIPIPVGCSLNNTCGPNPTGQIENSAGIAVLPDGTFYASANLSGVVLKETPNSGGYQETQIGPAPGQPHMVKHAWGLALDCAGNLIIADWGLKDMQGQFTSSQVLRIPANDQTCSVQNDCTQIGTGISGPYGVAVGPDGGIYISASSIKGSPSGIVKVGP